jgi:hypothetical protein
MYLVNVCNIYIMHTVQVSHGMSDFHVCGFHINTVSYEYLFKISLLKTKK